jgi:anaerobic selenocysteine-containing dehydrogenase
MDAIPSSDELLASMTANARIPLDEVKRHPHGAVFEDPPQYVEPGDAGCDERLDVGNVDMMEDLRLVASQDMLQGRVTDVAPAERGFRLVNRRAMHVYNSSYNDVSTNRGRAYNPAFMHPDDLAVLGLAPGAFAELTSDVATVVAVVEADPNVRRGVVSMSAGFGDVPERDDLMGTGTCVNRLLSTDRNFDRYSGQPLMSNVPIDVRPASAEAIKELTQSARDR